QYDQAMALGFGLRERALDQRLADATLAERRLDRKRTEQERLGLADVDRGEPHRTDEQRADARGERQFAQVLEVLANAVGGLGEAAGAERALMQTLDRGRIVRRLRQDREGNIAHRQACPAARLAFDGRKVYRPHAFAGLRRIATLHVTRNAW